MEEERGVIDMDRRVWVAFDGVIGNVRLMGGMVC